jgi:hypothetical protein
LGGLIQFPRGPVGGDPPSWPDPLESGRPVRGGANGAEIVPFASIRKPTEDDDGGGRAA